MQCKQQDWIKAEMLLAGVRADWATDCDIVENEI